MNCKTLSLETIPARLEDIIVAGIALEGDPGLQITGMAGLEDARAGQIGFLSNSHHTASLAETNAAGRPCQGNRKIFFSDICLPKAWYLSTKNRRSDHMVTNFGLANGISRQ